MISLVTLLVWQRERIMGVERKTLGMLVDELSIVNLKCFVAIDKLNEYTEKEMKVEAGEQAMLVHKLNQRRNKLIQAIDIRMGDGENSTTDKMYKDLK